MYTKASRNDSLKNKDLQGRMSSGNNLLTDDLNDDFQKVREKISETRQAITDTASHAKRRAQELLANKYYDVKEKTSELQDSVISYVKHKPITSIGIAIISGLIVAKLLKK